MYLQITGSLLGARLVTDGAVIQGHTEGSHWGSTPPLPEKGSRMIGIGPKDSIDTRILKKHDFWNPPRLGPEHQDVGP